MGRTIATAPLRVDLAGGSLDLWPVGLCLEGAMTLSVAVTGSDPPVRAEVVATSEDLDLGSKASSLLQVLAREVGAGHGFRLRIDSSLPRGNGLGTSSALAIAFLSAWDAFHGVERDPMERVRFARDIEAMVLRCPTGIQDHVAAMEGGVVCLTYPPGGVVIQTIQADLPALSQHLFIAYSGESHVSGAPNGDLYSRFIKGDPATLSGLVQIVNAAKEAKIALEKGDWVSLGRAMDMEMTGRMHLSPAVSPPSISDLLEATRASGAWGAKVCGAGGGGSIAVLAPQNRRDDIRLALEKRGATLLELSPTEEGVRVFSGG